jgi:hypothetical protein
MQETPEDNALNDRLSASKFSGEGFLGTDHRPVKEIISDDQRILERIGVTRAVLLAALRSTFDKVRAAFGDEVQICPGITAISHESMGRIPSPFQGDGVFEKGDVVVTQADSGEQLVITSLGLALIEKHGFFQGHNSRYRLDPERVAALFGLTPASEES